MTLWRPPPGEETRWRETPFLTLLIVFGALAFFAWTIVTAVF